MAQREFGKTVGLALAAVMLGCGSPGGSARDAVGDRTVAEDDAGGTADATPGPALDAGRDDGERRDDAAVADGGDAADADARGDDAGTSVDGSANADAMSDARDAGDARPDAGDARPDAGDADGPRPYAPCPTTGPCPIMPLGDSITYGFASSTGGGYRLRLLHDIWAARHDATFVGEGTSGPDTLDGKPFPKAHEGFSGYTIDPASAVMRAGISPLVPAALKKYTPAIVTLMIGTNDVGTNNDLANAPKRLAALIDVITTTSPNALVIVAQLTPTGDDTLNPRVQTYNAAIPAIAKSRAAAGKHVLLVDMYAAFTARATYKTDYLHDALHPNDAGYDLMGDTWFAALAPHL